MVQSIENVAQYFFELSPLGPRYRRARFRAQIAFLAVGALGLLGAAGWSFAEFLFCWRYGVWQGFLFLVEPALGPGIFSCMPFFVLHDRCQANLARAGVAALRKSALDGDQDDTPIVSEQPQLAASTEATPAENICLRSALRDQHLLLVAMGTVAGPLVLILLLADIAVHALPPANPSSPGAIAYVVVLALSTILVLVSTMAALVWARRLRRSAWFVADASGVRLAEEIPYAPSQIRWEQVRALYTLSGKVFCLDAGDRLLIWAVPSGRRATSHEQLMARIAASARVPLRDLSASARRLAKQIDRFIWTRQMTLALVPLALVLVVILPGSWVSSRIQAAQYQSLVARIHAEQPTYFNPLARPSYPWPFQSPAPTPTNRSYRYANGGLEIVSIANLSLFTFYTQQYYQDAAVQITVRQITPPAEPQYADIGLFLRGVYPASSPVQFTINKQGDWSASAEDFSTTAAIDPYAIFEQNDQAIHRGLGATNTLLVLVRGQQFLFFANGSYLGAYYEANTQPGPIALDGGDGTVFSNLTIYPAVYS